MGVGVRGGLGGSSGCEVGRTACALYLYILVCEKSHLAFLLTGEGDEHSCEGGTPQRAKSEAAPVQDHLSSEMKTKKKEREKAS